MSDTDFEIKYPDIDSVDVVGESKKNVSNVGDTIFVTDYKNDDESSKDIKKMLEKSSLDFAQKTHTYSRYLGGLDNTVSDTLTLSDIDDYAENPQNTLSDIKKINNIVKQYVNKDDIIGKVYESVQIYTNTNYSLKYPTLVNAKEKDKKKLETTVKPLIENFNKKVNMKEFISVGTSTAFLEGNFVSYLRTDPKTKKAVIDYYPISILEISEYNIDGEPAILFNVSDLKSKLRITSRKKKNGKDIFYDKVEEIIRDNYPKEVYDAYKKNEKYALLDPKRVGLVRINNLGGLYGLTPIFKALKPALLLESIENADETIVKVRSKKIVHQKLRKEIAGTDYEKKSLDEMSYAHTNLINAWKNKTVLVTTPWWVESISYVTCDDELTDTETLKTYRSRVFNALGINFMDTEASLNLSNVSIKDLMKTIDKIAEKLDDIINKYYKLLLEEANINIDLAPEIQITSSEVLSAEMKQSLAEFMYTSLGASLDTCYNIIGVSSAETEANKRNKEKENGIENALSPHANYYNQSGDSQGKNDDNSQNITTNDTNGTNDKKTGRPKSKEETIKQKYDETYNKSKVK